MGRHSIKVKITLLSVGIIASLIILILILNSTQLEKVYFSDKQERMLSSYDKINELLQQCEDGQITEEQMQDLIEQYTTSAAISVIVVSSDWTTVYANIKGEADMIDRLRMSIFNSDVFKEPIIAEPSEDSSEDGSPLEQDENAQKEPPQKGKHKDDAAIDMEGSGISEKRNIIVERERYTLQKVYDSRLGDDYYELWGTLDNGDSIMMRMAVQGIKDNVSISNKFITIVGICILFVGIIVSYVFSSYITKPIKQLSNLAERMAGMDFDVRYEGDDKSEIGVLGNSMNNMSAKLEENISQLKAANLELQRDIDHKMQIDEMRSDFLSNVSHELKTPIALIQGYAEGLKEGISDDPESMAFYCDVIMDEAAKMNTMVKKLLTLNQIEFGNEELVMERFDLIELLSSVIAANELRAAQRGITIEFEPAEKHLDVWSDEYKIEEVVTNYLTNAINHCDFEMRIVVKTALKGDAVRVSVFNTGKHIPQEDLENIWIKFYKVDKARTREYGGNGIGLSIVKAIMDSYGKSCGVNNVEGGVEFWFDLDAKA